MHAPALADDAGSKALAAAEAAMNKAQTQYFEYEVATTAAKAEKKLGMNVWVKGGKRLTDKYLNAEGKLVKTETRSGYTCETDVCSPGKLEMIDHTKKLATTLTRTKWKVNEPIGDEKFSKANLEK